MISLSCNLGYHANWYVLYQECKKQEYVKQGSAFYITVHHHFSHKLLKVQGVVLTLVNNYIHSLVRCTVSWVQYTLSKSP